VKNLVGVCILLSLTSCLYRPMKVEPFINGTQEGVYYACIGENFAVCEYQDLDLSPIQQVNFDATVDQSDETQYTFMGTLQLGTETFFFAGSEETFFEDTMQYLEPQAAPAGGYVEATLRGQDGNTVYIVRGEGRYGLGVKFLHPEVLLTVLPLDTSCRNYRFCDETIGVMWFSTPPQSLEGELQ